MTKSKLLLATAGIALSFASASYAATCKTNVPNVNLRAGNIFNGPTACAKGDTDITRVNGPLHTKGTTFKHDLLVNGVLNATQGTNFEAKLKVNGPVNLTHSTAKHVVINGPLNAVNSKIEHLNIASDYIKLSKSHLGSIVVRTSEPKTHHPKIYLQDNSHVKGKIIFKGPTTGIVYVENKKALQRAQVVHGSVKITKDN